MRKPHPATLGPSPGPWVRADAHDGLLARTLFEDRSPVDPELPRDIERHLTETEERGEALSLSHYRLRRDGTTDGEIIEILQHEPGRGWNGRLAGYLPRREPKEGWGRTIRHLLVGELMPAGQRPRWWRGPATNDAE